MLILNYTPNKTTNGDHPVIYLPDNEVESFVEQTIESYHEWSSSLFHTSPYCINIGQELIMMYFFVMIKEKRIAINEVDIRYNGESLLIDSFDQYDTTPLGFCDYYKRIVLKLMVD